MRNIYSFLRLIFASWMFMGGIALQFFPSAAAVERDHAGGKAARFPPSAPPVPGAVPPGTKYQSSPSDWQEGSWKTIGFTMDTPQYYRYSVVTSGDRKHATVRAEGDLDGDGKSSLYELPLELDKQGRVVEGTPRVTPEP